MTTHLVDMHDPIWDDLTVQDITIKGDTTVEQDQTLQGDTTIGDESSDNLDINATLNTDFNIGDNNLTNIRSLTIANQDAGDDPVIDANSVSGNKHLRIDNGIELVNSGTGSNPTIESATDTQSIELTGNFEPERDSSAGTLGLASKRFEEIHGKQVDVTSDAGTSNPVVRIDFDGNNDGQVRWGPGDTGSLIYSLRYDGSNTQLELESTDVDGGGTTGNILRIPDGQQDVDFLSDISFPNVTGTPTFTTHDHSEGGMTTIPNAGLANDSVNFTAGTGIATDGDGTLTLGGTGETLSTDFADDETLTFGTDDDWQLDYDSTNTRLRIHDGTNDVMLFEDGSQDVTLGGGTLSWPSGKDIAADSSTSPTFANLPSAADTANPGGDGWIEVDVNGTTAYVPYWV